MFFDTKVGPISTRLKGVGSVHFPRLREFSLSAQLIFYMWKSFSLSCKKRLDIIVYKFDIVFGISSNPLNCIFRSNFAHAMSKKGPDKDSAKRKNSELSSSDSELESDKKKQN